MKKIIELKNITKAFDGEPVLQNVNLDIYDNEFITLLGPSGCGKTTMLRLIGGFETPDEGDVLFLGKKINDVPPYKRNVNTVFQKYALFPHLNVFENVAFPLREKKVPKGEIEAKVHEMLSLVALSGFENRAVTRLSGGQQQRVAIARALVARPQVLLLDEPLGALDLKLRKDMQVELKKIQKQTGITFVFVTHDQGEALSMADRVLLMHGGQIIEDNTPAEVYLHPKSAFAADFIGASNVLEGRYEHGRVNAGGLALPVGEQAVSDGARVRALIKEENLALLPPGQGDLSARIQDKLFLGQSIRITLRCGERSLFALVPAREAEPLTVGSDVDLRVMGASVFAL